MATAKPSFMPRGGNSRTVRSPFSNPLGPPRARGGIGAEGRRGTERKISQNGKSEAPKAGVGPTGKQPGSDASASTDWIQTEDPLTPVGLKGSRKKVYFVEEGKFDEILRVKHLMNAAGDITIRVGKNDAATWISPTSPRLEPQRGPVPPGVKRLDTRVFDDISVDDLLKTEEQGRHHSNYLGREIYSVRQVLDRTKDAHKYDLLEQDLGALEQELNASELFQYFGIHLTELYAALDEAKTEGTRAFALQRKSELLDLAEIVRRKDPNTSWAYLMPRLKLLA